LRLNDIWICLGLPMVLFVMPKPLSDGQTYREPPEGLGLKLLLHTTMSQEFEAAAEAFGLSLDDFERITINAMKSTFLPI
jgi:Adenosine deaminase